MDESLRYVCASRIWEVSDEVRKSAGQVPVQVGVEMWA